MAFVRELYQTTYQRLLSPFWERFVRRRPTLEYLRVVEQTQWKKPEEIEQLQLVYLRDLLIYAGEHVPYYRELFGKLGFQPRGLTSREEIANIPPLTREIVRERYADLVAPEYRGKNLKKGTSGSTGTPLKFEYSRESESWRQAIRIRGYRWSGYEPGAPTFYYWAQVAELPTGAIGRKITLDRRLKREIFHDSMNQDEASMMRAVEIIRRQKPRVIICYVQSCAQFSRFIVERGLRDWPDIPILCGAEPVLPGDRAAIARAFGNEIFETYGSRETMLLGAECSAHEGMHLSEENLLVESAVPGSGKPAAAGEAGDVLVTDLHNYGMPFIRYANGDSATMMADAPCRCGRGLRRLARVEGRRADALSDREGKLIPGIVFHVLFSDARKEIIKQFQAVQKPAGDVLLKVVRGQDFSEPDFEGVVSRFGQYLRGLPLKVEFCERIPPQANGKFKTIVIER